MKIRLISIGKTQDTYLQEGMKVYLDRLKHYGKFEYVELPAIKNSGKLPMDKLKEEEERKFLEITEQGEWIILLDEKGKQPSSRELACKMEQLFNRGGKSVVFIIGGAYGFSPGMYNRANEKLALSRMTFSHQMVRLIALEQIYRGFTILRGEKYHH